MSTDPDAIRNTVRERYTAVAESSAACCGATADASCCGGYGDDDLRLLPQEAIASSRGCGNPTALAALRPGEVVLDLGSGGGRDVLLAAARVGPQGFVYGVDATPAMIDLARRNAAKVGATNVEFRLGDLEDLPLPDESIDVILSNCVINLTPDKRRALDEAFRVLRPGGRLAISDIVIDPDLDGFSLPASEIRADLDWAGCAAGALTTSALRSALGAAGFRDISLTVDYRMDVDDVPQAGTALRRRLSQGELQQLARRFTGMSITARKG